MINPYDHIDEYINGTLSGEQRVAFEQALQEDKTLKYLLDHPTFSTEVGDALIEEEVNTAFAAQGSNSVQKSTSPSWLKYAALVLILAGVGYLISTQLKPEVKVNFASLYHEPAWPITRTSSTDEVELLISKYFSGDTDKAKSQLIKSQDPNSKYWLSELYLKEQKADSVLHYLPSQYSNNIRRDRINYLEILSYHLKEDHESVRRLIDELPEDTDEWYFTKYPIAQ